MPVPGLQRPKLLRWTALPLAANALLYLAYRDSTLWCFRWVEALGSGDAVAALRSAAASLGDPGEFVRFSLASGLWILGVQSFLLLVWGAAGRGRGLTLWSAGILALCLGSELAQALGWIPGTADLGDVLAYLGGTAVALVAHGRTLLPSGPATAAGHVIQRAHLASLGLVGGALLLATGSIYAGAMGELQERWLPGAVERSELAGLGQLPLSR